VSTNTVKDDLLANLEDKEYRDLFVEQHINRTLAFQIRATRESQEMKQEDLGKRVGMAQGRISVIEDPNYGNLTIKTLKRVASALDVALVVRFVPFSEFLDWVAGVPHEVKGLTPESMAVPEFKKDVDLKPKEQPTIPKSLMGSMTGTKTQYKSPN
jgi:transcriptional regulator with XRE-family HTH domain